MAFIPALVVLGSVIVGQLLLSRFSEVEETVSQVSDTLTPQAQSTAGIIQNVQNRVEIAQRYLRRPDVQALEAFRRLSADARSHYQRSAALVEPQQKSLVVDLMQRDAQMGALFVDDVAPMIRERNDMAERLVSVQGPVVDRLVTSVFESSANAGESDVAAAASGMLAAFVTARVYLNQFLLNNDAVHASRVELQILAARTHALDLSMLIEEARRLDSLNKAMQQLESFEHDFARIVTLSHAINDKVDGVLATLSAGIVDEALSLQQAAWDSINAGELSVSSALGDARDSLLILGALLIALVIGVSWLVLTSVQRELGGDPREIREIAERIAGGDLGTQETGSGDLHGAMAAMQAMRLQLGKILAEVRDVVASVESGAARIASGNVQLTERIEAASRSLVQTATSIDGMTRTVAANAGSAEKANELGRETRLQAEEGQAVVAEAIEAMLRIDESSNHIVSIVSVIDEIAFNINLLALNAAVEAARAGEEGRGFSVVAAEVRSLAGKSSEAAGRIRTLIEASVEKIKTGTRHTDRSGETLGRIVSGIGELSATIEQIASAGDDQTAGINQINDAIAVLDGNSKNDARLVQETASTSAALSQEAKRLAGLIAYFRMDEPAGGSSRDAAA